jgi:beta-lactamase regulating signal transducer with metallopeptidase domain
MIEVLHTLFGSDLAAALVSAVLKANLVAGAAILAVAALRLPVRRAHGPGAAYLLWWAPPILAGLTPIVGLLGSMPDPLAVALSQRPDLLQGLVLTWGAGVVLLASAFALAQACFDAQLRAGQAGPAVVGFIAPRIVFPSDTSAYSEPELELIRAHEREHVARKDPRAVAVATVLQCLWWFNPLVHLAAGLLRLDQELACDAAVILRRPGSRGLYARTLLKSQMMVRSPPLACCWLGLGAHPLELRIANLKRRGPASSNSAVHAAADAIRP